MIPRRSSSFLNRRSAKVAAEQHHFPFELEEVAVEEAAVKMMEVLEMTEMSEMSEMIEALEAPVESVQPAGHPMCQWLVWLRYCLALAQARLDSRQARQDPWV